MVAVVVVIVVVTACMAACTTLAEHVTHIRSVETLASWRGAHAHAPRRLLFVDEAHPPSLRLLYTREHEARDDPFVATAVVYLPSEAFRNARPGEERWENTRARRRFLNANAHANASATVDVVEWSPGATHRYAASATAARTWVVLINQARPDVVRGWLARAAADAVVPSPATFLYCVVGTTPKCDALLAGPLGFSARPRTSDELGVVVHLVTGADADAFLQPRSFRDEHELIAAFTSSSSSV